MLQNYTLMLSVKQLTQSNSFIDVLPVFDGLEVADIKFIV